MITWLVEPLPLRDSNLIRTDNQGVRIAERLRLEDREPRSSFLGCLVG
jgi:hypothetical protein